ncbi:sodium:calcium antiporter [Streptomyces sp. NWU339]|uniref:sodium:calcium antiporter n=1 Tax=Streptomyces sp. NWU339 TaxID=2185284 RepID=UPI00215B6EE5|nr:sodium:calcium antiporter [Streptomyces sp. NWU339]
MIHFILLIVCAVAIYLSCEWFVNAVEWLGERLNVGKMAVGTILAAFGTALPESVVTLVAVTTGATAEAKNIGVGAAMGGPLALATVAYGVTGAVLLLKRRKERERTAALVAAGGRGPDMPAPPASDPEQALGTAKDMKRLAKDQKWFLPIFTVKVALGLVAFAFKPVLGLLFFAAYAVYFWREIRGGQDEDGEQEELEPLKFQPRAASPATWAALAQTLVTLAVIFFASQLFVKQLDAIGPMLGLSASVTALLLSPIATELPEIMNAVIWVRDAAAQFAAP